MPTRNGLVVDGIKKPWTGWAALRNLFYILVISLHVVSPAHAAPCKLGEIWAADDSKAGLRTVTYFVGEAMFSQDGRIIFEGWRRSKIYWRIEGTHQCSQGIPICHVSVPLNNGEFSSGSPTYIYEDEKPKYLVISGLNLFSAFVHDSREPEVVATWFRPKPSEDQRPHILLSSVYKFIGCLKGDELEAGTN